MPERNAVIHLASNFINRGFSAYAEASFSHILPSGGERKNGRIDLVASDGKYTFVIEVKTFGKQHFGGVQRDAERLKVYQPQADRRIDGVSETEFWSAAEKWACVVVQSFTNWEVNDLWLCQVDDPERFEGKLSRGENEPLDGKKAEFQNLAKFLRANEATTGCEFVCDDIWDCTPLHLLWAGFPLD